ncbi:MAG: UvrD-helicase domain-containing protein, partial [Prevotellaceae bacterium]|nr:UvrD-helicase domain-containing protein [Prevotellaceae bacterium]
MNTDSHNISGLTAYSASAGSGKTFRITREYLKLLLASKSSTNAYRRIVAVTFTNKATEEMKTRVIKELNELAGGNREKLEDLCKEFNAEGVGVNPFELQQRALEARGNMLHDYSRISILTIDKFFQKILRAFVNDAGLHPGFNIELDQNRLLEEAVDAVLENADNDEQRSRWLLQLVDQRIEDGQSWSIKKSLIRQGRQIFNESFKRFDSTIHEKFSDREFLQQYMAKLRNVMKSVDDEMKDMARKSKAYMQLQRLEADDFKGKSRGFIAHFSKIEKGIYEPTKTTKEAVNVIENWCSKDGHTARIDEAYNYLNPLLARACQLWNEKREEYNTADAILKNFMLLGLLADISSQVRQNANEENILPISDSTQLISGLVGDSDAPFIYEKIGSIISTFMIDEFQDTSVGQWNNFLPLLKNSLSEDNFCMVVGDVKQSIYRWRNGDWRILAYGLDRDLGYFGEVNRKTLKDNWRSLYNVVLFNNELFKQASEHLQGILNESMGEELNPELRKRLDTMITSAYADCEQNPKRDCDAKGHVRFEVVNETESQASNEVVLSRLPLLITELQDKGYEAGDIAILIRNNRHGQEIANALMRYKQLLGKTKYCFDVVSRDSLLLRSSSVVKLYIALLRIAVGQKNDINEAFLRHELEQYIRRSGVGGDRLHVLFSEQMDAKELRFLESLTLRSLTESFELIVQRYRLNLMVEELPFLQALHDLIISFSNRKLSDIDSFLQWWDEGGNTNPLQSPEGQNAITISSIHKSKGLQYKVVIVPYCSWELDTKVNETVWVQPHTSPFDELPSVPVAYSKKLENTIFTEQYCVEKAQAYVDNLNLLYVALTRAEEQLYVYVPMRGVGVERKKVTHISHVLSDIFTARSGENNIVFGVIEGQRVAENVWEFGSSKKEIRGREGRSVNAIPLNSYPSESFTPRLKIHYAAQNMLKEQVMVKRGRSYGTLMHKIFELIRTPNDIGDAVDALAAEGWLTQDEVPVILNKVR